MDIFGTTVLNRVVENLDPPNSFLLDNFFPQVQTEQSEEIHFDTDSSKPRLAPFVSPLSEGKVMPDDGYETNSFRPAYVKDKRRFEVFSPLRRWAGEKIGGTMTPMARRERQLNRALQQQLDRLTRREELMAAEALLFGRVTVSGEKYPTRVVDFKRDPALTITLGASVEWGDTGVDILDSIEMLADTVQSKSSGVVRKIVMDPKAAGLMRRDERLLKLLDIRREPQDNSVILGPMANKQRGRRIGTVGDFEFWIYQDVYLDDDGIERNVMPDYSVVTAAENVEGTRCYGAILDEEANYTAERYYSKSWIDKDPPIRWLLMQSAPLVVPFRPNATASMIVKA